eukprot:jgi/Tetstr1/424987/TSEL_015457.t1
MFYAAAEGVGELSLSTIKQGDMANLAARHSDNICSGGGVLNPYASPGYPSSAAYRAECQSFLQRCNPVLYGATSSSSSVTHDCSQYTALAEAVCGLVAAAVALASAGRFTALTDPTRLSLDDPANTWAYSGRLHRPEVQVLLPLLDKTITLKQFWMTPPDFSEGGLVDGHTTGSVLWDGAVVLADFLTHCVEIMLSCHHHYARFPQRTAEWRWEDKTVVELGAGLGLLSCTAALLGAKEVFCTDGDGATLRMAQVNADLLQLSHPGARNTIRVRRLKWGEGQEGSLGAALPVDVVVASDVLYVLDNPGAWGAFLRTLLALCSPATVVLLQYTDRGHPRAFVKFMALATRAFHIVEVPGHLLHPTRDPLHKQRIEKTTGTVQLFCLSRRAGALN